MPKFIYILIILLSFNVLGCAGIEPPSPERILRPLGDPPPLHLGDTKDSVRDVLGEPDEVRQMGADDVGLIKEEWVYHARAPKFVDREYMRNTLRLVFTGDTLTIYKSEQPQAGQDKQ